MCPDIAPRPIPIEAGVYIIEVEPHCQLDAGIWFLKGLPVTETFVPGLITPAQPVDLPPLNLNWSEVELPGPWSLTPMRNSPRVSCLTHVLALTSKIPPEYRLPQLHTCIHHCRHCSMPWNGVSTLAYLHHAQSSKLQTATLPYQIRSP
jgi:hypothetical protein